MANRKNVTIKDNGSRTRQKKGPIGELSSLVNYEIRDRASRRVRSRSSFNFTPEPEGTSAEAAA